MLIYTKVQNHRGEKLPEVQFNNGSVKYILSEFTKDNFSIADYKDLHVEHIFAKEPNYEATSYGFSDDYDYEKNRLGNLGLLEQSVNIGLGNLPPINKVSGYLTSSVTNTRNLAGVIQQGNFTKTNIDNRRQEIIDFCLERFKTEN